MLEWGKRPTNGGMLNLKGGEKGRRETKTGKCSAALICLARSAASPDRFLKEPENDENSLKTWNPDKKVSRGKDVLGGPGQRRL